MIRKLLFFLIFIISNQLYSNITEEFERNASTSSLADLEGEPSSIIHGHVSVITGAFIDTDVDLFMPGPEPLYVMRFYSSFSDKDRSLGHGWLLNHHGFIEISKTEKKNALKEDMFGNKIEGPIIDKTYALMTDEYRSTLQFSCDGELAEKKSLKIENDSLKLGVTNCSKALISGRTNPKNIKIKFKNDGYHAYTGGGIHYTFDKNIKDSAKKGVYRLQLLEKPYGNKLSYDYGGGYLNKIKALNKNEGLIGSIAFHRSVKEKNSNQILIKSSHGHQAAYIFNEETKTVPLTFHVIPMFKPELIYTYSTKQHHDPSKIIRMEMAHNEDHFLEVEYNAKGINKCGPLDVNIDSHHDLRHNRVRCLKEPVGIDNTPVTTFSFVYETGR